MRVHYSQENLSGKGPNEQSGENWVTIMEQSGHEGEEQSVVGQAGCMTYSFQEGISCQMPKWRQVVKRGAEQPRKC